MTVKAPEQPYIYEGLDEQPFRREARESLLDQATAAVHHIRDTFAAAQKPGMPLSVLSNVAREAPLASLLAAFLVGVAVARRR
jgi:hypothetical protein